MRTRVLVAGLTTGLAAAALLPAAASSPTRVAGRTVGVVRDGHASFGMSQSGNWSGYNKGVLETGTTFHSISGQWVVPSASAAHKGQDEASSTWVGIGGGCLETSCLATDATLIQAGTEQDVAADGKASYSTWYEIIPAPSLQTPLAVRPHDRVAATIAESLPGLWTISLANLTTGHRWSTTIPYTSTYATAEWVEETPLVLSGGPGFAAMPKLGTVTFTNAKVNGGNADLDPAEAMQLVDPGSGKVLATPSLPNAQRNAFNDCVYATSCRAP